MLSPATWKFIYGAGWLAAEAGSGTWMGADQGALARLSLAPRTAQAKGESFET